jgi:hypothetical protein
VTTSRRSKQENAATHVEQDRLDIDLDDVFVLGHVEPGRRGAGDDGALGRGGHGRHLRSLAMNGRGFEVKRREVRRRATEDEAKRDETRISTATSQNMYAHTLTGHSPGKLLE